MIKENNDNLITVPEITTKVKSSLGKGRGTLILAVIGILLSLGSSFLFCLASIGFDFSQFKEMTFWSRWASMSISALFAYALVLLHKDEVNRLNKWYVDNLKLLADKSAAVGDEFDKYLQEVNLKRRIEWFKNTMNAKIGVLNAKLLTAELKGKSAEKFKMEIEKYKQCLTDDYIEANKHTFKTGSVPFSRAQILSESQKAEGEEENFRSATGYYAGKAFLKLLFSLITTVAFACVVVQNFGLYVNVASIVMTIMAAMAVLTSVVSAVLAANGCYRNIYVPNLQLKLKILAGFEKWQEEKIKN